MKYLKGNYHRLILVLGVVVIITLSIHDSIQAKKANDELFNAYIDQQELINKQIGYINELTDFLKNVNDKMEKEVGDK